MIMDNKDFDPTKIKRVPIDDVEPNDYNPKEKDTPEYQNVLKSLQINGLKQPIFVREVDDNDKYVIVDGEQRWTAAKELGYTELYVYNLGKISEEEAKSLTIWMEVAVPFSELQLAPIVLELNSLDFELPYEEKEIEKFKDLTQFSFEDYSTEGPEPKDDSEEGFKTLTIRMTAEQFEDVNNAIKTVAEGDNVSDGRALQLLTQNGLLGYPFDGTGNINLEDEE